ncbi:uncharacterized protein METZ01_LOCUS490333, partial [marine metagenome]
MKILIQLLLVIVFSIFYNFQNLIPAEKPQEWIQLFNGKNLEGWEVKINGFASGENAFNTFRVKNNSLVVSYEN